MKLNRHHIRQGFTLIELTIVLMVFSIIVGVIWSYAQQARQAAKVQQSMDAVNLIVDAVRNSYAAKASITGGVSIVMPYLVSAPPNGIGSFPQVLLSNTKTTCGTAYNYYANTPWGSIDSTSIANGSSADVCGTLRVCAWNYTLNAMGGDGSCNLGAGTSDQFFAVEFTGLDYGSCISLAENISLTLPSGLKDVIINGNSGAFLSPGLPVKPTVASSAATGCIPNTTAILVPNTVDFIYSLSAPLS